MLHHVDAHCIYCAFRELCIRSAVAIIHCGLEPDKNIRQTYGAYHCLTHWGRMTHICVSKLTIIASDNGLSPGRRQAIIWTNAGILLIGTLGTNFSEIWIEIYTVSFKKMHLKMSSGKWRPFCLGLNVLMTKPETLANDSYLMMIRWRRKILIIIK